MCERSCSTCAYMKRIPGDCHIKCDYPLMNKETSSILSLASIANPIAFNQEVERMFGFTASEHGLLAGYFCFPDNFDPTWMNGSCNKHSDLVGEAVKYQQTLDLKLNAYYVLLSEIEKKEKEKSIFQPVIDAYELAINNVTEASKKDDLNDDERAVARDQLVVELGLAYDMLQKVEVEV